MKIKDGGKERDDHLPSIPFPTPEQLKEIDIEQARRARLLSIASNDNQRTFARAMAEVESYRQYTELPKSAIEPYAQALAIIGHYDDAYKLTKDKLYKDIAKALTTKGRMCKCKDTITFEMVDSKPVEKTYSRMFVKRKVFSTIDGKWHDLMACNICSKVTVV